VYGELFGVGCAGDWRPLVYGDEEKDATAVATGKILRFDEIRGYGFIAPDAGGEDVFLHANALLAEKHQYHPGVPVEFDIIEGERGLKATAVRVIKARAGQATATSAPTSGGADSPSGQQVPTPSRTALVTQTVSASAAPSRPGPARVTPAALAPAPQPSSVQLAPGPAPATVAPVPGRLPAAQPHVSPTNAPTNGSRTGSSPVPTPATVAAATHASTTHASTPHASTPPGPATHGSTAVGPQRSAADTERPGSTVSLTPAALGTELVEVCLESVPSMTGEQITQLRRALVTMARRHGWVND